MLDLLNRWRSPISRGGVYLAAVLVLGLATIFWVMDAQAASLSATLLAALAVIAAVALIGPHRIADMRLVLVFFSFLFIYAAGISFSYFFIVEPHPARHNLYLAQCAGLALSAIMFTLGAVAARLRAWIGFVAALVVIALLSLFFEVDLAKVDLERRYGPDQVVAGFQQLGDAVTICALVLATRLRRPLLLYLLAAAGVTLLIIIPSRSATILGVISLMFVCVIGSPARMRLPLMGLCVVIAIALRLVLTSPPAPEVGSGRTAASATDTGNTNKPAQNVGPATGKPSVLTAAESGIMGERNRIFDRGVEAIREHPIAGWFGFQLDAFNRPGMHMRNFMDAWAQAGAIAIIAFLLLWLILIRQWYLSFHSRRDLANRLLPMLAFPALAWLASRPVSYSLLYFCVGFFAAALAFGLEDTTQ